MLNSTLDYYRAGAGAGKARREKDEGRCRHFTDWFNRALALEKPEDRSAARKNFNDGYRNES